MAAPTTNSQPFARGSIIWEKKGPLPVWAWALIVLGLVLAVVLWRNNRAASTATTTATGDSTSPGNVAPNQKAPPVFILPGGAAPTVNVTPTTPITINNPPTTVPEAPAGGGRDTPPGTTATPPQVPAGFRDEGPKWTDSLVYRWNPVPGAASYVFSDGGKELGSVPASETGWTRRGLLHNGQYFTQIAAVNAAGQRSAWSQTLVSRTKN